MDEKKETQINEIFVRRMCNRIYRLERDNMITNAKSKMQMMDAIKKIIEEEANKCY